MAQVSKIAKLSENNLLGIASSHSHNSVALLLCGRLWWPLLATKEHEVKPNRKLGRTRKYQNKFSSLLFLAGYLANQIK